jgi:hypothetical protein
MRRLEVGKIGDVALPPGPALQRHKVGRGESHPI